MTEAALALLLGVPTVLRLAYELAVRPARPVRSCRRPDAPPPRIAVPLEREGPPHVERRPCTACSLGAPEAPGGEPRSWNACDRTLGVIVAFVCADSASRRVAITASRGPDVDGGTHEAR
jgi:hypothetical protein